METEEERSYDFSEQWKHGGDCAVCRRQGYCRRSCKPHKENFKSLIYGKVAFGMMNKFIKK